MLAWEIHHTNATAGHYDLTQWVRHFAQGHNINFSHLVPLNHRKDPFPAYMEILEPTFTVNDCSIMPDVCSRKQFDVVSKAKPSGSKRPVSLGGNQQRCTVDW